MQLLTHWSYVLLEQTHRNKLIITRPEVVDTKANDIPSSL